MGIRDSFIYIFFYMKKNIRRIVMTTASVSLSVMTIVIILIFSESFNNHLTTSVQNNSKFQFFLRDKKNGEVVSDMNDEIISDITLSELNFIGSEYIQKIEKEKGSMNVKLYIPKYTKESAVEFGEGKISERNVVHINKLFLEGENYTVSVNEEVVIDNKVFRVGAVFEDNSLNGRDILFSPLIYENIVKISNKMESNIINVTFNSLSVNKEEKEQIISRITQEINSKIKNSRYEYRYEDLHLGEFFLGLFQSVSMFILIICLIVLIISSIGVSNIMYISVLERKEEIIILKLLGMEKYDIQKIFLLECILIMSIATLLGIIGATVCAWLLLIAFGVAFHFLLSQALAVLILIIFLSLVIGSAASKKASNISERE